jgi:hypothetical protein
MKDIGNAQRSTLTPKSGGTFGSVLTRAAKAVVCGALAISLAACGGAPVASIIEEADPTKIPTEPPTPVLTSVAPPRTEPPEPILTPAVDPPASADEPVVSYPPIDYTAVSPYEVGQIMIIMYHEVVDGEAPSQWQRNADDFRNDLQTLYDRGFRLCSVKDVVENNITVEAGYTPVSITFDDGLPKTFSLVDGSGGFEPAEGTAIAIMEEFCQSRPDFGRGATLFINNDPFRGAGTVAERLNWLVDRGYDIGNHTYSHAHMSKLDKDGILSELGEIDALIRQSVPGYAPVGMAYPYGDRPKGKLKGLVASGEYDGASYYNAFGLKEGYNGKPSSANRVGFDPLNMPRVCGSSLPEENAYDLGFFLEFYQKSPEFRYVSDGDPDTVSVPEKYAENVDKESLNGKRLVIY